MADDTYSRYEVNRSVRMVLTRHDVDLMRIDYSYLGNTIYLYGELVKSQGGEFNGPGIEGLARELTALPRVRDIQFDLHNWVISSAAGSWFIGRAKKAGKAATADRQGAATADSTVVIEKAEKFGDVLQDIDKKKEGKKGDQDQEVIIPPRK